MLALKNGRTMREKLLRSNERLSELDNPGIVGIGIGDIGMDSIRDHNSACILENDSTEGTLNLHRSFQNGKLSFMIPATIHSQPTADPYLVPHTHNVFEDNNNKINSPNGENPWSLDDGRVIDAIVTPGVEKTSDDNPSDMWVAADKLIKHGIRRRTNSTHSTHTVDSLVYIKTHDDQAGPAHGELTVNLSKEDSVAPTDETNISQSPHHVTNIVVVQSPTSSVTSVVDSPREEDGKHFSDTLPYVYQPPNQTDSNEKSHITRIAVV